MTLKDKIQEINKALPDVECIEIETNCDDCGLFFKGYGGFFYWVGSPKNIDVTESFLKEIERLLKCHKYQEK